MNTKLTLTIEEEVIEKAKKYAKKHGRSLSELVQNYFRALLTEDTTQALDAAPLTSKLRGSFSAPEDFDYKKELIKSLKKKYS